MSNVTPGALAPEIQAPANIDPITALQVERSIVELQRGRGLIMSDPNARVILHAVQTMTEATFAQLATLQPRLLLSQARTRALGATDSPPQGSTIDARSITSLSALHELAGLTPAEQSALAPLTPATPELTSALELARLAQLMPALLVTDPDSYQIASGQDTSQLLDVSSAAIHSFQAGVEHTIERISSANVPLAGFENCEFVVYQERFGAREHVAIVIGKPDRTAPVMTRLHSACLTGDLFGSLRCDCGPQLRLAVDTIAANGGGVLLYLSQEGRGIGLTNKLRAYRLQDSGLDTIDADQYLGFAADARSYGAACAMLRDLGISQVRLMTNNPNKMKALSDGGIRVAARTPLPGPVNPHNARYLRTKRDRAGHLASTDGQDEAA